MAPVGSGMPSRRVTSHPASQSALAAPKPPQPAPTTATLGLWPETTSSEGEDASAGADEVEAARTTTRAREATQRRRCAKRGAKNAGDATRAGMAADARVAVCCDRGGGRNETPRESRTPRGARSELAHWRQWTATRSPHAPSPRRRAPRVCSSAAPRVSRGRDADVDVARPRPPRARRSRACALHLPHALGRTRPPRRVPNRPRAPRRDRGAPALGRGAGRVHAHGRRHPGGLLRHRLVRSVRAPRPRPRRPRRRARGRRPARHRRQGGCRGGSRSSHRPRRRRLPHHPLAPRGTRGAPTGGRAPRRRPRAAHREAPPHRGGGGSAPRQRPEWFGPALLEPPDAQSGTAPNVFG